MNALGTPWMIFSHEQKYVSLKLTGYSPYSQMLRITKMRYLLFVEQLT